MDFDENTPSYDASKIAAALIANGYAPIPIAKGEKGPRLQDWPNKSFSPEDFTPRMNVGIRCSDGGVYFLDIDVMQPDPVQEIVHEWERRFGELGSHMRRTGRAPKTGILFRSDPGQSKITIKLKQLGEHDAVEVLGLGQQFVAYGRHPDTGQDYYWHGVEPAAGTVGSAHNLPFVTKEKIQAFLDWVEARYGLPLVEGSADRLVSNRPASSIRPQKIIAEMANRRNCLPLGSYESWMRIGFGLRHACQGVRDEEEGRTAFVEFSRRWENGDTAEGDIVKLWNSWKHDAVGHEGRALTGASAMRELKKLPRLHHQPDGLVPPEPASTPATTETIEFTGLAMRLQQLLDQASEREPGILLEAGVLASLSALLGPVAVLQNGVKQKCCSNLYILALAGTGQGKENPRKLISALLKAASRDKEVMSASPSDVSFHRALSNGAGRVTLMKDEAGLQAKTMKSGSQPHQQALQTFLMEVFGRGLSQIDARLYSDSKKDIEPVEHPRPTLFLTSTPETFIASLERESSASGFLNRLVTFVDDTLRPLKPRGTIIDGQAVTDLPDDVAAAARRVHDPHGMLSRTVAGVLPEIEVWLTAEALELLDLTMREEVELHLRQGGIIAHSWVRFIELTQRVATLLAVSDG